MQVREGVSRPCHFERREKSSMFSSAPGSRVRISPDVRNDKGVFRDGRIECGSVNVYAAQHCYFDCKEKSTKVSYVPLVTIGGLSPGSI